MRTGSDGSAVRPVISTVLPAGTASVGRLVSVTRRTSTSPVIPGWMVQWYGYAPTAPNVQLKRAPLTSLPDANSPPSAVTVCVLELAFVHATVSPGRRSTGQA